MPSSTRGQYQQRNPGLLRYEAANDEASAAAVAQFRPLFTGSSDRTIAAFESFRTFHSEGASAAPTKPKVARKMAAPTREEFDKGLELNQERFSHLETRLLGEFKDIRAEIKMDVATQINGLRVDLAKKPGTGTLIGVGVAIVGVVIALFAFGGDRFDGGVQVSSVSLQQAQDARELAEDALGGVSELQRQNEMILQLLQERVSDEP